MLNSLINIIDARRDLFHRTYGEYGAQVMIVLIKSIFFYCCFCTGILFATEDKAVYCINKEEPETLSALVRNIEQLFVFPDTVIGTESSVK